MRFDDIAFLLQHYTSKIVELNLKIKWQFQAAGAGLGKFGSIRGCSMYKRSAKSWIPLKITCNNNRNNSPKKKILRNGPVTYTKSSRFIFTYIFCIHSLFHILEKLCDLTRLCCLNVGFMIFKQQGQVQSQAAEKNGQPNVPSLWKLFVIVHYQIFQIHFDLSYCGYGFFSIL